MTAPSATSRTAPGGIPLKDGHPCKITLATDPDISFWERSVKPPSLEGGEAIDFTTMHNTTYRTKTPRSLIDLGEVTCTAEYDPVVYDQIVAVVNVETTITIAWADGSTLAFFGYLRTFDPQNIEEGNVPICNITIVPTNWDPAGDVEAGPTMVEVAGT